MRSRVPARSRQSRAEFRAARRKRALILLPGTAVVMWSLANLVAARHGRLSALEAGFVKHVIDHALPVLWTLFLVQVPFLLSLKPKPKRSGAVLAMFTGPVLTPLVFGAGGWRLWQIAAFAGLVLWIESGDQMRARRRPSLPAEEPPRPVAVAAPLADEVPSMTVVDDEAFSSVQAISGASFQSRSNS